MIFFLLYLLGIVVGFIVLLFILSSSGR